MDKVAHHQELSHESMPHFGDVIFTREPTKTSCWIRLAQILAPSSSFRKSGVFSHVAFVIDVNNIIHATLDTGVDMCGLHKFFNTPGIEFIVLRGPASIDRGDTEARRAYYYHDQPYDMRWLKRFLAKNPNAGKQVCSSLVANILSNSNLAQIEGPNFVNPMNLLHFLGRMNWVDVTRRYEEWLRIRNSAGYQEVTKELCLDSDGNDNGAEFLRQDLKFIHDTSREQREFPDSLRRCIELDRIFARILGIDESIVDADYQAGIDRIKEIDEITKPIEGLDIVFHDTK